MYILSDLLIKGGLVVTPFGVYKWDVKIVDGIIVDVSRDLSKENIEEEIDANGLLVFPGFIDEHVHMREPGLEYKDDFEHGSKAAIKGGVTTVIEHPNTLPPVDNAQILLSKAKLLQSKAYVDFALLGVLHDSNTHEFDDILSEGAAGFKVFMGPTTGDIPPPGDHSLYEIMCKSSKTNTRIMFHAEDYKLVSYFTEKVKKTGKVDPLIHEEARPPIAEVYSIAKIAVVAKYTGGKAHIVHVSSNEALQAIKLSKENNVDITAETCPHYIVFEKEDYFKYGTLIKVNPPIRGGIHRKMLLEAIKSDLINTIGSDHAPHTPEEKYRPIFDAAAGFPGVQTLIPLMLDLALRDIIPLTKLPLLLSENPAKLFGLYPYKGAIMPGSSGDLVIVDPGNITEISGEWLEYKYKLSPYIGWKLRGKIKHVILKGCIAVRNGELTGVKIGSWIKPVKKRNGKN